MRRATSGSSQSGFTLLEMMIVLGLMAMGVALLGPMIPHGTSPRDLERLGDRLVSELRLARTRAMRGNVETALAFDPASRTFVAYPAQTRVVLPREVGAQLTTGREVQDGTLATIRFLPDGRSSGGDIRLTLGAVATQVTVDWLTGWVRQTPVRS